MPKLKSTNKQLRVVVRYEITRIDGQFWGKAYDQGNNRYPEADILKPKRNDVCEVCRHRVNKSWSDK